MFLNVIQRKKDVKILFFEEKMLDCCMLGIFKKQNEITTPGNTSWPVL